MRISNVHERVVDAEPEEVAPWLATMGQEDDALYPPRWEPMRLDGPLAVGASGTHGTITAYEPGRFVIFALPDGVGVVGTHAFTVDRLDGGCSRVRHEVDAEAGPMAWLAWKALIEPSHDAVLEQVMDRLQSAVGTPPAQAAVPPAYARLLRWFERPRAHAAGVPTTGLIVGALPRIDVADMFVIERRRETTADPDAWAQAIFVDLPPWVDVLLRMRERLDRLVGIERRDLDAFAVIERSANEVLLGADAEHLDVRTAVRCEPTRVVLSSAIQLRGRRGRASHAVTRHLYPLVMSAMLDRAAQRLARDELPVRAGPAPS